VNSLPSEKEVEAKREKYALYLALIAPVVMILSAPLINRTEPYIAGMPFIFFWHLLWLIIGPIFLTIAYLIRVGKIKV